MGGERPQSSQPEPRRVERPAPPPASPAPSATPHLRQHHLQNSPLQLRKLRLARGWELAKVMLFQDRLDLGPRRAPFRSR